MGCESGEQRRAPRLMQREEPERPPRALAGGEARDIKGLSQAGSFSILPCPASAAPHGPRQPLPVQVNRNVPSSPRPKSPPPPPSKSWLPLLHVNSLWYLFEEQP